MAEKVIHRKIECHRRRVPASRSPIAGIFDDTMLNLRSCAGFEISRQPICCAVSIHHRLAGKNELAIQDLYGERLMLMHRNWSHYVDVLRDDIWQNHSQIQIPHAIGDSTTFPVGNPGGIAV